MRSAFVIGVIMPKAVFTLSKKNDWETPPELFKLGCDFFGHSPQLDVCATAENSLCKYHYSEQALTKPFDCPAGFWCNPPYSDLKTWIRKCYLEHVKHNVSGLMLVFAKTDTAAFHDYVFGKAELLFIRGRIHFYDNGIPSKNPAPYASCFIFFRRKYDI